MTDVSIVIPAFNEQRRLPATLRHWLAFLGSRPYAWEIIVVDDGSTDRTADLVMEVAADHPGVQLIRQPHNQGKGAAVRAGVLRAAGAHVFYVDADMNVAPRYVVPFVEALTQGADVVIGARGAREYSATERSLPRLAGGLLVQVLRRALLLPALRDTQCGFKAFNRGVVPAIFGRATVSGFAFDIELLFIAGRLGLRVTEIPVRVAYRPGGTYSVRRHLWPFLREIVAIKRQDVRGVYRRGARLGEGHETQR